MFSLVQIFIDTYHSLVRNNILDPNLPSNVRFIPASRSTDDRATATSVAVNRTPEVCLELCVPIRFLFSPSLFRRLYVSLAYGMKTGSPYRRTKSRCCRWLRTTS